MNMKISPGCISYKLPVTRKIIEIPNKCRNKAIAVASFSTLEAGAGLAFAAGGIVMKDPAFAGVGLSILGVLAGSIAMLKGSLWDFAGKFLENKTELLDKAGLTGIDRINKELENDKKLLQQLQEISKN